MLYAEWDEVRAQLGIASRALSEHQLTLPWRWERLAARWMAYALWFFMALVLVLLSVEARRALMATESWRVLVGTLTVAWTIPIYLEVALALAGLSLLRYRLALRSIMPEVRPVLVSVAPWTIALTCAPLLLFAGTGLPSPEVARGLATLALVAIATGAPSGDTVELLVELGPDDHIEELALPLLLMGATSERAFPTITQEEEADLAATWLVTVPRNRADLLTDWLKKDDEDVDSIEINALIGVDAGTLPTGCIFASNTPWSGDPLAKGQPELTDFWTNDLLMGLARVNPSQPVLVGVIDTGIDGTHEELRDVTLPNSMDDDQRGHGTRVAGLIAAVGRNGLGIVTPNIGGRFVRVRSYPALASRGAGVEDIVDALDAAMDDGARVINMSFGSTGAAPLVLRRAVAMAHRRDVLLIASAGNTTGAPHDASEQWPANVPGVLVVGALDRRGQHMASSYSVGGVREAMWAPGEALCTTDLDDSYTAVTGTSFAAAIVSGLAATMRAVCPKLSETQMRELLAAKEGGGRHDVVTERGVFPWLASVCN